MHLLLTFIHYFHIDINTLQEFCLNNEAMRGALGCRRWLVREFSKKAGSTVRR